MKFLLVLALVGLGYASFCENESADSLREIIKPMFVAQVRDIFGHCKAFKMALRKDFGTQNQGDCSNYFDELYCFGDRKMNEFSEADDFQLTYNHMAQFIADGGDGRMLGEASCRSGLPCLNRVVKTLMGCAKRDESFWDTAISVVEDKLSSAMVQDMITQILESWEEDDPMRMIADMIRARVTSWDDLKAIIDEHIPQETQETMIAGAKKTLHNFISRGQKFCRSGCLGQTADYFTDAFSATHDDDTCPAVFAWGFCGNCQANMESYIESSEVPCCTQDAVVNIAESIIEKIDQYYELFKEKETEVIDAISHIVDQEGIDTYYAAQTMVAQQADCLRDTYETLADQACMAA